MELGGEGVRPALLLKLHTKTTPRLLQFVYRCQARESSSIEGSKGEVAIEWGAEGVREYFDSTFNAFSMHRFVQTHKSRHGHSSTIHKPQVNGASAHLERNKAN